MRDIDIQVHEVLAASGLSRRNAFSRANVIPPRVGARARAAATEHYI